MFGEINTKKLYSVSIVYCLHYIKSKFASFHHSRIQFIYLFFKVAGYLTTSLF
jgi:hypothetical protein